MDTKQFFNNVAPSYDSHTDKKIWMGTELISKKLISLSNKNSDILDIGIGTGKVLKDLITTKKYQSLSGVDISEQMLEICKTKFPDIKLFHGEIFSLTSQYDIITCCGTFQFIQKPKLFLKHVRKLLKPGGTFIFNYELLINNHAIQKFKKSRILIEKDNKPYRLTSYIRRYNVSEMKQMLSDTKFNIFTESLLVAYIKFGHEIIYQTIEVT